MKKHNRRPKKIYKVMWSYYDSFASTNGVVSIEAHSRDEAEAIFYKLNHKYILGHHKDGSPIINARGGYVCEGVLTMDEWIAEGMPTTL